MIMSGHGNTQRKCDLARLRHIFARFRKGVQNSLCKGQLISGTTTSHVRKHTSECPEFAKCKFGRKQSIKWCSACDSNCLCYCSTRKTRFLASVWLSFNCVHSRVPNTVTVRPILMYVCFQQLSIKTLHNLSRGNPK